MFTKNMSLVVNPDRTTPLAAELTFKTVEPISVTVLVRSPDHEFAVVKSDQETEHDIPILGMKPGRTYELSVIGTDNEGSRQLLAEGLQAKTFEIPDEWPTINTLVSKPEKMEPGYTLFHSMRDKTVIVDAAGDIVWFSRYSSKLDVKQFTTEFDGAYDGMLFTQGTLIYDMLGRPAEGSVAANEALLKALADAKGVYGLGELGPMHHEAYLDKITETFFTLGRVVVEEPSYPTSLEDPTPQQALIVDEPIIEYDIDGEILNVWKLSDILDTTRISQVSGFRETLDDTNPKRDGNGPYDWPHANAILTDHSDNSIIVSMRGQNAIVKFSRETGKLIWILGDPDGWAPEYQKYLLKPTGGAFEWFYGQHAPMLTEDGDVLLFDNGNWRVATPYSGRTPMPEEESYSRLVAYHIDPDRMEVSQSWEFRADGTDSYQLFANAFGDADELPQTGNVLGVFSGVRYRDGEPVPEPMGKNLVSEIVQVTQDADPEVVFRMEIVSKGHSKVVIYRAEQIPSLYGSGFEVSDPHDLPYRVGMDEPETLHGDDGTQHLWGLGGDDRLYGMAGSDRLYGGDGDDIIGGGNGADRIEGGGGADVLAGGRHADELHGGADDDRLRGNEGNDLIIGGKGDDVLHGDEGMDRLRGSDGADQIYGGDGDDIIGGGDGADRIEGGSGADILGGGRHADELHGGADDDRLHGNEGNDLVIGARGDDVIYGDEGLDRLRGGDGADRIYGGGGADEIRGGRGNDRIDGGAGDDKLAGHQGHDIFAFAPGSGEDTILDFENGIDQLAFAGFGKEFDRPAAILAMARQEGGAVVIDIPDPAGGHTLVRLLHIELAHFDAGDLAYTIA